MSTWGEDWRQLGSYGYNWIGTGAPGTDGSTPFISLGLGGSLTLPTTPDRDEYGGPTWAKDVLSPSHMIAIGDAVFTVVTVGTPVNYVAGYIDLNLLRYVTQMDFGPSDDLRDMMASADQRRHEAGRRNTVFCDGHVECLALPQLFNYTNDAVLRLWNKDYLPRQLF